MVLLIGSHIQTVALNYRESGTDCGVDYRESYTDCGVEL